MEQTVRQQLSDYIVAHQEEFYRLAYSYVKNRDAALDVVPESIVKALAKADLLIMVAYSYLKNREEALDAVQTAVCRAWEQQDRLREPEAVRTWFYRILLNESMNHHRRAKRLVPLEDTLLETPVPARDPGERLDLYDAIERLDWKEQTVVRLRFFEDMKLEEIARVTNTNLNTVKSRLYKSLRRLRELTEEEC